MRITAPVRHTILDLFDRHYDEPYQPPGHKVFNGIRLRNKGGKWL